MKHKYINSSLSEDGSQIIFHNYVSLAIAVGMDDGLLVPVIQNADKMTLSELVVNSKENSIQSTCNETFSCGAVRKYIYYK